MSRLSPVSAPSAGHSLAALVGALLSNPVRPDSRELPAPSSDLREPQQPAPELSAVARVLSGPTGLGTAAARRFAAPQPDRDVVEPEPSMPDLFCPGPVRDNPGLGEEVNDRLVDWAEEVGIYLGDLDRLRECNFGRLIMLAHPATDDPDRLLAASKCVVAEWAADDYYVDEVQLGADPRVVGSRLATLHAVVDPAQLPLRYAPQLDEYRRGEPIATAFRAAMEHLARYTSAAQMGRFQHQMAILFVAWNQEADWHRNGHTPAVWEYLVQRHLNSYLPPMILIDVVAGYELSAGEFYDPRVRRAFTLAGDANVLLNDLYSAGLESDTDFNLPRVIVSEEQCSWEEAIKRTVEIHNELMHMFVAEAGALSITGSPALQRFLLDTWAWLGGSREWHATTGRYHAEPQSSATAV
ncbi:MAG: 2-methylisoborneol synthase [Solirubrobacteraceae bacterium]|nr:2-methylisoborneol synthase [Solirubrobacteraceae bacterium]